MSQRCAVCIALNGKPIVYYTYKCTEQQFIHLLMATCNDWHIKNSKYHKKVMLLNSTL